MWRVLVGNDYATGVNVRGKCGGASFSRKRWSCPGGWPFLTALQRSCCRFDMQRIFLCDIRKILV